MSQCIECTHCGEHHLQTIEQAAESIDAQRYRWLRLNPGFETEMVLGALSPEEYDALVDSKRKIESLNPP